LIKKERWSLDKSEKEWEKTVHYSGEEWRKTVTMRVIVIELLFHLCWFPIAFADYHESEGGVIFWLPSEEEVMLWLPKVFADYQESEGQVMEETETESTWEERAIEVLEQILSSKLETPPPIPTISFFEITLQDAEWRHYFSHIEWNVKDARYHAQNLLSHIKKRNATASKSLWETSAKSAREARQLAEEAASFTKDVPENISEERKRKAVATIASHVEAQIGRNNRSTSQFYNSQKTADAFLVTASKDGSSQLSSLKSELDSFRLMAKVKVDAVSEALEDDVNQTIEYLHLAESLRSEPLSEKWTFLEDVAAFAKEEAVRHAREASQESLNDVQNKFDSFKEVNNEKAKHFEYAIEDETKEIRNIHKEIIENWTRTNHDAIAISRKFFNFTEVQSVLGRAKSAIDRTKLDIKKAKHSSKWVAIVYHLVRMSESVERMFNAGRDLETFQKIQLDKAVSMYGKWAHDYGLQANRRVLRLKNYLSNWIFSKINQTKSIDLREAVIKLDDAKKDSQRIAEISLAAVEDATSEMRKSVDLVQEVFHETEVKAEGINEEYRQKCFVAFREAKDVVTETKLAIAREVDYIKRTAAYNFHQTKNLVLKAERNRILTIFCIFGAVGITFALVAKFHRPRGRSGDANQEKLLELLRQHQHQLTDDDEASKCKVCMDADIDCVILDCGHLVTCSRCGKKLTECPICRQKVLQVLPVAPVTEKEMMRLTTWQVKRLLTMCGIGFKDRVLARTRKMEEGAIQEKEHKCKMCMERVIDCVFLNCGHLMTCTCCGEKLVSSSHYTVNCPICQKQISRVAKIYTT